MKYPIILKIPQIIATIDNAINVANKTVIPSYFSLNGLDRLGSLGARRVKAFSQFSFENNSF